MASEEYHRYLASREWALLKQEVAKRSEGRCERCIYAPASQVHHLTYIRLRKELLGDLLHVCRLCHEFLSGKSDFDPQHEGDVVFNALKEAKDTSSAEFSQKHRDIMVRILNQ